MKKQYLYIIMIFALCIVIFASCKKEEVCYTCIIESTEHSNSNSSEFCGENAKDLGEIWLSTSKMSALLEVEKYSITAGQQIQERLQIEKAKSRAIINASKCVKGKNRKR